MNILLIKSFSICINAWKAVTFCSIIHRKFIDFVNISANLRRNLKLLLDDYQGPMISKKGRCKISCYSPSKYNTRFLLLHFYNFLTFCNIDSLCQRTENLTLKQIEESNSVFIVINK